MWRTETCLKSIKLGIIVIWLYARFPALNWQRLHIFAYRRLGAWFPTLATGYYMSYGIAVTYFPTLDTGSSFQFFALAGGYMLSRAFCHLNRRKFPHLTPVTCFLALGTGYICSRAFRCLTRCLHVLSFLALVICMFSSAWQQLH